MVSVNVMQSMAIDPGDGIDVKAEGVVHNGDEFHEPFFVVERTVSDSQMKNVGQIQAAKKPASDEINAPDQQAHPRAQMSWREIHTSQRVEQNNQTANDVVDFHRCSCRWYSNRK